MTIIIAQALLKSPKPIECSTGKGLKVFVKLIKKTILVSMSQNMT